MANAINKVIITNRSALLAKYGAGLTAIEGAIKKLVAADAKRGLTTRLIAIDDAATMKAFRAAPVTKATDPKQCKGAIDAVFRALCPEYLMILGAVDVVPHQDIKNPAFGPGDDDDREALGDIPYACDAPYSTKPENFKAPTRVVGRLPDLTGGSEPQYLIDLLATAASAKSRPASAYADYLGVSAEPWANSTSLSLQKLFGPKASALLSPPSGPRWKPKQLQVLSHFFNCHGAPADSHFYGQHRTSYPQAHDAAWLKGRVSPGTVLSAECCYGAELYDPAKTGGQAGLCNTYLGEGAYGVFGSSTIAYGPAKGNGSADLLCQFFLKHVLEGASLGRAALEARQDFVRSAATLDPFDLKTLAQFSLMGDPSIQPVEASRGYEPHSEPRTKSARASKSPGLGSEEPARELRRSRLARDGVAIGQATRHVESSSAKAPPKGMLGLLAREARGLGVESPRFASFDVAGGSREPKSRGRSLAKSAMLTSERKIHMMIGHVPQSRAARAAEPGGIKTLLAIVVTEWDGQTLVRRLHSR